MLDQHHRHIHYLRLSVTDRCNLRCAYCMPELGVPKLHHRDILSFEEYVHIITAAANLGVDKIRITGGEPLVRKGIESLVEQIKSIEGIKSVNMTTNGVLLKEKAHILKMAGLDRVNVSLDTLNPDRYREITRGGELKQVLDGIDAALASGFDKIKINTVLIGGINTDELDAFLAFSGPQIEVRFIELMPIGEAANWAKERFVSAEDWLIRDAGFVPLPRERYDGPARYFTHPTRGGRIGIINPISEHFCNDCNRVRITAEGRLKTCLHSQEETDLTPWLEDPDRLLEVFKEAIHKKPQSHHIGEEGFTPIHRDMNSIGG